MDADATAGVYRGFATARPLLPELAAGVMFA